MKLYSKGIDIKGVLYVLIAFLTAISSQGNAHITRATVFAALTSAAIAWKAYISTATGKTIAVAGASTTVPIAPVSPQNPIEVEPVGITQ